jgi:hypothetical protein
MPYISDGEIRSALKRVERTRKQETLVDGEGHGTGRLVLSVRPMPTRVTADWMAQQWRDKKRIKKKLGAYPSMSLSCAREIFDRDFAGAIQKGRSIKIATDAQSGTVADLFAGYVESLKAAGKPSWKEAEKGLNKIANTLGTNRPAREIEPEEIVEIIRPIYERGARSMADHVRSYIRSAFAWGMKSEHDYRRPRRGASAFHSIQRPAFRPSPRSGARVGSTMRSLRGSIGGWIVRMPRSTPPTLAPSSSSCLLASASTRSRVCM